nr:Druantia anti-phage system protein DruA [uncultured Rhodopila sp.]
MRHQVLLEAHRDEILAFEQNFESIFVDMTSFQPSAVRPILEIVDFRNPSHMQIVDYLRLYQTVTVGKLVGRRMGLLIWDIGQTGPARLLGAAVLASARFSQRIRDRQMGWPPDFPRTSPKHDTAARAVRVYGLGRIMQLSMVCSLPPYSVLSGAWLAALAPFTSAGLDAFRASLKSPDPDADLASVVTTTGKAASGSPFHGHRVVQIAPGASSAPGARGDLYSQAKPDDGLRPLRASFEILVSEEVRVRARELFRQERPEHFARLRLPDRSAMAFALRRLGLRRWIFDGNEIGVHIGMLGEATLDCLRVGRSRPVGARPILDWGQAVGVWSRRFLPSPEIVGESADHLSKAAHREARQKRLDRARDFPTDLIRLSSRLRASERVADIGAEGLSPELKLPREEPAANRQEERGRDGEAGRQPAARLGAADVTANPGPQKHQHDP